MQVNIKLAAQVEVSRLSDWILGISYTLDYLILAGTFAHHISSFLSPCISSHPVPFVISSLLPLSSDLSPFIFPSPLLSFFFSLSPSSLPPLRSSPFLTLLCFIPTSALASISFILLRHHVSPSFLQHFDNKFLFLSYSFSFDQSNSLSAKE